MQTESATEASDTPLRCTLILPTYNAANFIAGTVERVAKFLDAQPDWCALFVCDGCEIDGADAGVAAHSGGTL